MGLSWHVLGVGKEVVHGYTAVGIFGFSYWAESETGMLVSAPGWGLGLITISLTLVAPTT